MIAVASPPFGAQGTDAVAPEDPLLTYGGPVGLVRQPGTMVFAGSRDPRRAHLPPPSRSFAPGGAAGVSLFLHAVRLPHHHRHPAQHASQRGVRARRLLAARARRLLPAALLMIAVISVVRTTTGFFDQTKRPDAVLTALQVNNWFQVYRDPLGGFLNGVSGFAHMWSLSIEEQFYIVIALAMVVLARRRTSLRTIAILATVAATASFLVPVVIDMTSWRTYLGTDTRAGEILVGTTLATILFTRRERELLVRHHWWFVGTGIVGTIAMTELVLRASPFAYGLDLRLFPYMSALSASIIVGALVPGPLRAALGVTPLTWLGQRSYAIYLFHIPVVGGRRPGARRHPRVNGRPRRRGDVRARRTELSPDRDAGTARGASTAGRSSSLVTVLAVIVTCSFVA